VEVSAGKDIFGFSFLKKKEKILCFQEIEEISRWSRRRYISFNLIHNEAKAYLYTNISLSKIYPPNPPQSRRIKNPTFSLPPSNNKFFSDQ
jgi:hypothetical protein